MAKKKKGVTIGLSDLITQPRKMSRLPMLDSRIGVRTLLAVLQRMQGLFNAAKSNERDPQLYMKFVTDQFEVKRTSSGGYNEGDVVFHLSLSDIAEPNHYPEARVALESFTHVNVMTPIPDQPNRYRTESLMHITGEGERQADGTVRFVGTEFEVVIPRITAENILDINLLGGYTRFLLFTASQFRSDYAYSLYIRLSDEWRRRGDVFDIGYEDLRQNMGFVVEQQEVKDKEGRAKTVTIDHTKKHASWSLFCKYVLNQSKEELDKMAAQLPPKTDFTFEYEGRLNGAPLPKYKRPDAIRFTIIPTSIGKQLADDSSFASQSIIARKMMTTIFNLTEGQARTMMKRVTPDNVDALIKKMKEMQDSVRSGKTVIRESLAAWALTCIREFLTTPTHNLNQNQHQNPNHGPFARPDGTLDPSRTFSPSPRPNRGGDGGGAAHSISAPDSRAIYEAVRALQQTLTPEDYEHWAQPVISQQTPLDGNAITVRYHGPYYRQKRARQQPAFLAVLQALRTATDGRIQDITAIHCDSSRETTL